jgi:hypothetical protein
MSGETNLPTAAAAHCLCALFRLLQSVFLDGFGLCQDSWSSTLGRGASAAIGTRVTRPDPKPADEDEAERSDRPKPDTTGLTEEIEIRLPGAYLCSSSVLLLPSSPPRTVLAAARGDAGGEW